MTTEIAVDIGIVIEAEPFPQARKPALKLVIDFGPDVGRKKSSAQITEHYKPENLIGRQVCAVPPRQIGPFVSEVLTLGFHDDNGHVVLINADKRIPNGAKLL